MRRNIELNKAIMAANGGVALCTIVERDVDEFNVVNCVSALQKMARAAPPSRDQSVSKRETKALQDVARKLIKCCDESPKELQTRHVSSVLWVAAKMQPLALNELVDAVVRVGNVMKVDWFKEQEISITCWALGKLKTESESAMQFLSNLLEGATKRNADLGPQGVSNTIYGLANLRRSEQLSKESIRYLMNHVAQNFNKFNSQELANTVYGIGKLGIMDVEVQEVCNLLGKQLDSVAYRDISPMNAANIIWGLAKCVEANGESLSLSCLKSGIVKLTAAFGSKFNEQELSMCTWASLAFQVTEYGVSKSMQDILRPELESKLVTMNAQQISTIGLSLAKSDNEGLVKSIVRQIFRISKDCGDQDIDHLTAALARWQVTNAKASLALAEQTNGLLKAKPESWSTKTICNVCLNFAKTISSAMHDNEIVQQLSATICNVVRSRDLAAFNARDVSNLVWGLATLGVREEDLMQRLGDVASNQLDQFNAQECSKMLFALNKAGVKNERFETAATTAREQSFSFPGLSSQVTISHMIGGGRKLQASREETGTTGATGSAIWQDSALLAAWLVASRGEMPIGSGLTKDRFLWSGKSAVELGAGVGLCSIVASCIGMNVTATDGDDEVLQMMKQNIKRNKSLLPNQGKLKCRKHVWGESNPLVKLKLEGTPNVILATGVVYGKDDKVWKKLYKSIKRLAGEETLILMAHGNGAAPGVHQLKGSFYERMTKRFNLVQLPFLDLDKSQYSGCQIHALIRKKPILGVGDVQSNKERVSKKRKHKVYEENAKRSKN